ncbi:MAG: hypothetical protein KDA89_01340, partial [Planctomycetaceae bacterium]|nr:hypothetical protein [Planctomycetaceae bacterium]
AQQLALRQQTEDLQQQRELFGQQLEAEQQRLREEIEKRRRALLTEQNNLQRRYRFQFEHLSRAREDFETERRELRREQQILRSERCAFDEQHRLRFGQLQRLRQILEERDVSLQRELKVIERSRVAAEMEGKRRQDRLADHQDAVMQDLESRTRQLNQAEQSAAETARRVEQRRQHVNQMRAELDAKQREILEQRLLLEELQESQTAPADSGRTSPRLQQARKAVEQFFDQLHQHLRAERDRLEQHASELTVRQDQFRRDRTELERWFAEKELELAQRTNEQTDTAWEHRLAHAEQELADVRRQWHHDLRQSEASVRRLQDRIADLESQAFRTQSRNIGFIPDEEPNADTSDERTAA